MRYVSTVMFVLSVCVLWRKSATFVASPAVVSHQVRRDCRVNSILLSLSASPIDDISNEDDEEAVEVEPGTMRVSEIKAELDMRGVKNDDCFDKESLVLRLETARSTGKADPSILTDFNKRKLEENVTGKKVEMKDADIESAVANDGTLPGGLSPDKLKELIQNPEVMTLLQSTKMQEAMKLMMTGGQDELEKAMTDDPEMREVIGELNKVLGPSLQ